MASQMETISTTTTVSKHSQQQLPPNTRLSLWLVPPEPQRTTLQSEIDRLAKQYGGPTFPPHVTLMGRIEVTTLQEQQLVIDRLHSAIRRRQQQQQQQPGSIKCRFESFLTFPQCWNQALIAEMEQTPDLIELCDLVRQAVGQTQSGWKFPSPSNVPHLSLFYGTEDSVPAITDISTVLLPLSFDAHKMEVYRLQTGLEYVPTWERMATIDLCYHDNDNSNINCKK
ncbi:cyclic phosphodiesterase-like protein [Nitzschia inconspicua]|uniref:Cyclic phosphodiesterase-like protein n=1 Tax=Nitzschia inconspicua TaxID=303405 RepID=A0A9K3LGE8_9STRA|nr:cyclic phosphodiesterase-like protein [Nitzschia inconspicua]